MNAPTHPEESPGPENRHQQRESPRHRQQPDDPSPTAESKLERTNEVVPSIHRHMARRSGRDLSTESLGPRPGLVRVHTSHPFARRGRRSDDQSRHRRFPLPHDGADCRAGRERHRTLRAPASAGFLRTPLPDEVRGKRIAGLSLWAPPTSGGWPPSDPMIVRPWAMGVSSGFKYADEQRSVNRSIRARRSIGSVARSRMRCGRSLRRSAGP